MTSGIIGKMKNSSRLEDIQYEYDRVASTYDTRWNNYLASTHNVALTLLKPTDGDKILDASGGTGLLAERILSKGHTASTILIDLSGGMIRNAEKRLDQYPNVQLIRGDVHYLPFPDEYFSKIVSANAFHHYTDLDRAVSEFYRVLKPDGTLVIVDWNRDTIRFKVFDLICRNFCDVPVKIHTTKELEKILTMQKFEVQSSQRWNYGLWSLMGIKAKKML